MLAKFQGGASQGPEPTNQTPLPPFHPQRAILQPTPNKGVPSAELSSEGRQVGVTHAEVALALFTIRANQSLSPKRFVPGSPFTEAWANEGVTPIRLMPAPPPFTAAVMIDATPSERLPQPPTRSHRHAQ